MKSPLLSAAIRYQNVIAPPTAVFCSQSMWRTVFVFLKCAKHNMWSPLLPAFRAVHPAPARAPAAHILYSTRYSTAVTVSPWLPVRPTLGLLLGWVMVMRVPMSMEKVGGGGEGRGAMAA